MAKVDDKQIAIARVYSQSMLTLADRRGEAATFLAELEELVGYLEQDQRFADFLGSPLIDSDQREKSIEKIFRGKASDLLVNSLQVLNRKGRLGLLATVVEQYKLGYEELQGQIVAYVRTAVPLGQRLRHKLKSAVSAMTGKEADLVEEVDELLIGGLVMQVGDRKIDASVLRDLQELRETLHERAAQEIFKARREGGMPGLAAD